MNTNYVFWRSRTFWALVAMAIIGGGNALVPVIPPEYAGVLTLILGFIANYFHLQTAAKFGATN